MWRARAEERKHQRTEQVRAASTGRPAAEPLGSSHVSALGPGRVTSGRAWGLPCRLFPLVLVQVGGGEVWGLTTGAKALFCFTAETMLAGEKEKMPEELLQLEGRLVEEAMVGLDGTTGRGRGERRSAPLLASRHRAARSRLGPLPRPPSSVSLSETLRISAAFILWYLVSAAFRWW